MYDTRHTYLCRVIAITRAVSSSVQINPAVVYMWKTAALSVILPTVVLIRSYSTKSRHMLSRVFLHWATPQGA